MPMCRFQCTKDKPTACGYPRKARTSPLLFPYSFEIFLMFSQPGMWLLFMLTYSGQSFHVFWCQFWEHRTKLFKALNVSTTVLGDPVNDRFTITSSIPKVDLPSFSLAYRSLVIRCEKSFAPFLVALYQKYHMVSILMMMISKCKGCLGFFAKWPKHIWATGAECWHFLVVASGPNVDTTTISTW